MNGSRAISLSNYAKLLITYLKPQGWRVVRLGALLGGSIAMQLLNPQILRVFIDSARAGHAFDTLIGIAVAFLAVALAGQAFGVAAEYVGENVGWTATNRMRADLALHCLRLDMAFHKAHNPGELIERVDGDVQVLGTFFGRFSVHVLGNALLLLGVLALLFRVDSRVGAALSLFAVVALILVNSLRGVAVPFWERAREAHARLAGYLEERVSGTEDIRGNGATAYVLRGLYGRSRDVIRSEVRAGQVAVLTGNVSLIMFTIGTAISFAMSALLMREGSLTLGGAFLIFSYSEIMRQPLEQITRQLQELQQAGASMKRIQQLFDTQPTILDGVGKPLPATALPLRMEHVSFTYDAPDPQLPTPDQSWVLRDIHFELPPGRVLGLLGRTGSGKTTLTRLLFRLYDPTAGNIYLDNVDIRDLHLSELRQRIGMVTQEIQLFHATLRDNLCFFDRSIQDRHIEAVLDDVGLGEWYRSLPDGLDTRLAPGGSGLSAGQAQLLAFTRVFLRNPALVILDEASSRLDPATERLVERAVTRLLRPAGALRSGIIIAHRLATVERVDDIMILERGQIVEYGPRELLANDPDSRFARLLKTGMEEALA